MRFAPCLASTLLLALAAPLAAQQRVDVRRAAAPDISVRLAGSYAALRIVGTASDSLVITGTLPKGARFESFAGEAGNEPLRGAKLFVEVPDERAAAGGSLELRVPRNARVWAKAGNATIEASGVMGGLDLNVVGGSIRVTGSPRELNIESMDGAVTIEGDAPWMRAKTAAGDITLTGSGSDVALTTVSGTIRVTGKAFERARFEAVTGGIEFAGDAARGGALAFETHSGFIDVRLRAPSGARVEAASIAGSIDNQFTRERPKPGRNGRGQELAAVLGGEGAHVQIRTFKGIIRLASR